MGDTSWDWRPTAAKNNIYLHIYGHKTMDPPFFHLLGSLADRPVGIFIAPYQQPTRNPLKISH